MILPFYDLVGVGEYGLCVFSVDEQQAVDVFTQADVVA